MSVPNSISEPKIPASNFASMASKAASMAGPVANASAKFASVAGPAALKAASQVASVAGPAALKAASEFSSVAGPAAKAAAEQVRVASLAPTTIPTTPTPATPTPPTPTAPATPATPTDPPTPATPTDTATPATPTDPNVASPNDPNKTTLATVDSQAIPPDEPEISFMDQIRQEAKEGKFQKLAESIKESVPSLPPFPAAAVLQIVTALGGIFQKNIDKVGEYTNAVIKLEMAKKKHQLELNDAFAEKATGPALDEHMGEYVKTVLSKP